MNNTIALAFLCADDRMTWFSDDDRATDHEPYFDDYAFSVWNDDQHNERSEPMTERCYCHRYNRYCGLCRPY